MTKTVVSVGLLTPVRDTLTGPGDHAFVSEPLTSEQSANNRPETLQGDCCGRTHSRNGGRLLACR